MDIPFALIKVKDGAIPFALIKVKDGAIPFALIKTKTSLLSRQGFSNFRKTATRSHCCVTKTTLRECL